MGKLYVVGIGPGDVNLMSGYAIEAIKSSDVVCGYKTYVNLITELIEDQEVYSNGMKEEVERVKWAIKQYERGKTVSLVCGGDASLYALASLVFELCNNCDDIEIVPGITAAMCASAKVGAPVCEDLVILSLSDLLTPWELIEKRIDAVNFGDFVVAIYNPKSKSRDWQLKFALEKFYKARGDLICASVRHCSRGKEEISVSKISNFNYDFVDMATVVIVGNRKTYIKNGKIITPRGYLKNEKIP